MTFHLAVIGADGEAVRAHSALTTLSSWKDLFNKEFQPNFLNKKSYCAILENRTDTKSSKRSLRDDNEMGDTERGCAH